jgi:ribosomal protein S18 acetylase RimI-like enzyme
MQIRDAHPSDRDSIIALDQIAGIDSNRVAFIDQALESLTCLVAESSGHVVGYGVLEYSFFSNGFISMIYVANPERGNGVGSALLHALAERCNTPKLFTSTNESNDVMRSLLRHAGFVPSGVIYNLDHGDPECVYFKSK